MLKENSDDCSLIIENLRGASVEVHFRERSSRKAAVFTSFSMINSQNVCGMGLCRGYLRKWLLNIYNRSWYTLHSVLTAGALLSVNESSAHQQPIITKWYWLTTAENNRPRLFKSMAVQYGFTCTGCRWLSFIIMTHDDLKQERANTLTVKNSDKCVCGSFISQLLPPPTSVHDSSN